MEKAEGEYRKYQVKTLSSVEKAYIETLKELKQIECNSMRQGLQGRLTRVGVPKRSEGVKKNDYQK